EIGLSRAGFEKTLGGQCRAKIVFNAFANQLIIERRRFCVELAFANRERFELGKVRRLVEFGLDLLRPKERRSRDDCEEQSPHLHAPNVANSLLQYSQQS